MATAYSGVKLNGAALAAVTARSGAIRQTPLLGKLVMTTSFVINDTIVLCPIPAGVTLMSCTIDFPILDTGSGMTIVVGDNAQSYATTGQTNRIISAVLCTNARFASITGNGPTGALGRKYTTADSLILTVVTGPQTGATTGTITYMIDYTVDP